MTAQLGLWDDTIPEPCQILTGGSPHTAAKFRSLAAGLDSLIAGKLADRLTNTHKRARQAASARSEGERLQRTQQALYALAELHEAEAVPEGPLKYLTNKKEIYEQMGAKMENCGGNYIDTGTPRLDTPCALALWAMLKGKSSDDLKNDVLRRLEQDLQFSKIPGYFATPPELVDRMIELAGIEPHHRVLDPSAGSGSIIERLPDCALDIVFEINHSLCEILRAKGWDARPTDFLQVTPSPQYDRILMNPPFEKLADVDHVSHAYGFLAEGGRLISIMSPGPFFRDTKKCQLFRQRLEEVNASVTDLPAGSFKQSGTNVASKLVVINHQ